LRLEAVGKRYAMRQPWVIRDVSTQVPSGRLIRLEGRNGSGKSTLLRVVAGVLAPTAGKVTGRPRVGYVPERFPPALPFSGRDYLMHLGRWQIDRGQVTVAEGADPAAMTAAGRQSPAVVIEVPGSSPGLGPALRDLPGVHSVSEDPERTVIRSDKAASDAVLRVVLAWPGAS
jgi:ABC-2 type transport system ATP-binding protein